MTTRGNGDDAWNVAEEEEAEEEVVEEEEEDGAGADM
jgi:hypothetical protein